MCFHIKAIVKSRACLPAPPRPPLLATTGTRQHPTAGVMQCTHRWSGHFLARQGVQALRLSWWLAKAPAGTMSRHAKTRSLRTLIYSARPRAPQIKYSWCKDFPQLVVTGDDGWPVVHVHVWTCCFLPTRTGASLGLRSRKSNSRITDSHSQI